MNTKKVLLSCFLEILRRQVGRPIVFTLKFESNT